MIKSKSIEFLKPAIKAFREGGQIVKYNDLGPFFIKLLWVRDQAHIFHWQTKLNSEHAILGDFYEEYLNELDALAESIFGQRGYVCSVGDNTIKLKDYSKENIKKYIREVSDIFNIEFHKYIPDTKENIAQHHILGDLLEIVNRFKYLMSQE